MKIILLALLAAGSARPGTAQERERPVDPAAWGREFPIQYDMWRKPSRIDAKWTEKRGHAFSLKDRDEAGPEGDPRWAVVMAGRPKPRPGPSGCLECHASEPVRGASYWEARRTAKTPVACVRCHDARTLAVKSKNRSQATVCADCHTEYYIDGGVRRPVGASAGAIEEYYDRIRYRDWAHAATGAPVIEPQHPQFEMNSQGMHVRSGVGCPDCHMPRIQSGNARVRDHQIRSPLENLEPACAGCHRLPAAELRARVKNIQDRTEAAEFRALGALVELINDIGEARANGVSDARLDAARAFQRRAQWRIAFVHADRSKGFHAPHEAAALLLEAIDYARRGQMSAARASSPRK